MSDDWRCSHGTPAHANCVECTVDGVAIDELAPTIHYSNWSQQPDVWLSCGRWTTPVWSQRDGLEAGVYEEDDGDLYTFEHFDRVNCQACLTAVSEGKAEPR